MDKEMVDPELKPGDSMDHSRWKTKISLGYWCDSN